MPRCSSKTHRHAPSCTCLLEAYRKFPAAIEDACECPSPECPVRNLDSATLHKFLEAIGGPDGGSGLTFSITGRGDVLSAFRKVAMHNRRPRPE